MNNRQVISVRGLSKKYFIGTKVQDTKYTFFDTLLLPLRTLFSADNPYHTAKEKEIWALKDISFDVNHGEKIGIIGRNGAGKSTLLKILSRLVYPTEGEARIRGRVTSLLEVGTGFRPNLTGRENIYLNASLHGLHRNEIDEIFDNIVEFSGVKKFIDTPVKYYSTGMYSRLAFAVAAHLDPDILLLDEVLAVGDMAFQEKCLKRVGDLTSEGRTILFVSHSMGNIIRFCDKTIWLEEGRVVEFGDSKSVVDSYSKSVTKLKSSYHADTQVNIEILENKNEHLLLGSPGAELISFEIKDIDENPKTVFFRNETIKIYIKFRVLKENINFVPCFHLYKDGVHVFSSNFDEVINLSKLSLCSVTTAIPPYHLNTGNYQFSLEIVSPTRPIFRHVSLEHVLSCKIVEEYDPQRIFSGEYRGVVRPRLLWALSVEETRIE